jgi:predicted metal-dependent peptidase
MTWFVSSYPLLGALAAGLRLVEDVEVCQTLSIAVAAVSPGAAELYVNPQAGLDEDECRFVIAHELLHAGLRHDTRAGVRDHWLFNVACDYAVNGWLYEMHVGVMPEAALFDRELVGMSAEEIYDRIAGDLRKYRKLATLRGLGLGDVIPGRASHGGEAVTGIDLDEFYKRALTSGLEYHNARGRGFVPAGLEQEIRALTELAIPWDVDLARWFDERFPPIERRRSYARPSRRQSSTPDIPRPSWMAPEELITRRTFGVVLDTSGSMGVGMLGKGLGAIASYAASRDVPAVRVVFCDAVAYDAGYMDAADIAGIVRVRGRGGTVLQPGVDLLEHADDFPETGPILVITDGQCDRVRIRRDHGYLVPAGARLPFRDGSPVFRFS